MSRHPYLPRRPEKRPTGNHDMKAKTRNSFYIAGTLACAGVLIYGCASKSKSDTTEDKPFQTSLTPDSDALTTEAEVVTELNDVDSTTDASKNGSAPKTAGEPEKSRDSSIDLTNEDLGDSGPEKLISYKVRRGDTLMEISFKHLGNVYRWREIYHRNKSKLPNFNAPKPGTLLSINVARSVKVQKNGTRYAIKRGDTLGKISNWVYGTISKWRTLWKNNVQLIHNPNKIYAGFDLYYTGKRVPHGAKFNLHAPASVAGSTSLATPPPTTSTPAAAPQELEAAASSAPAPGSTSDKESKSH